MIILDTNVSEDLRPKPSAKVLDWMRSQPITTLFTTTITEAELYYGLALLPSAPRGGACMFGDTGRSKA
jgi:toxin FitB